MPDNKTPDKYENRNKASRSISNQGQSQPDTQDYSVESTSEIGIIEIINILNRRIYGIVFILITSLGLAFFFS